MQMVQRLHKNSQYFLNRVELRSIIVGNLYFKVLSEKLVLVLVLNSEQKPLRL
jgi:hypothetical protein